MRSNACRPQPFTKTGLRRPRNITCVLVVIVLRVRSTMVAQFGAKARSGPGDSQRPESAIGWRSERQFCPVSRPSRHRLFRNVLFPVRSFPKSQMTGDPDECLWRVRIFPHFSLHEFNASAWPGCDSQLQPLVFTQGCGAVWRIQGAHLFGGTGTSIRQEDRFGPM